MFLKKELNISSNLDKLKELNMMKLNIKFKDLKFNKQFNNQYTLHKLFNKYPYTLLNNYSDRDQEQDQVYV